MPTPERNLPNSETENQEEARWRRERSVEKSEKHAAEADKSWNENPPADKW